LHSWLDHPVKSPSLDECLKRLDRAFGAKRFDRPPVVVIIPSPEVRPTVLGAIRCLGRERVPVIAVSRQRFPPSFASRYVQYGLLCPDQAHEQEPFVRFLEALAERVAPGPVLYYASDLDTVIVSRNAQRLGRRYRAAFIPRRALTLCTDKWPMLEAARRVGMDVPRTSLVKHQDDVESATSAACFPAIVKPLSQVRWDASTIRKTGGFTDLFGAKAVRAGSPAALRRVLREVVRHGVGVLVQEEIPGPCSELYSLFVYADRSSRVLGMFFGKKIRQLPSDFGSATLAVSLPVDEGVARVSAAFIADIGFHGIAELEWKYDRRDGLYQFMEINPRCSLWTQICQPVGVNLPYIQYLDLIGSRPAPVQQQRGPVKFVELYRDAAYFLLYRRGDHVGRRTTLAQHLDALRGQKEFAYFAANDRLPGLVHLQEQVRGLAARAARKALAGVGRVVSRKTWRHSASARRRASEATRYMDVSVSIVSWNVRTLLRACLDSLLADVSACAHQYAVEVIVVDNASADGTCDMLKSEFPGVRLVANPVNKGFAAANNQAYAISRGQYFMLLNPDTVVRPGALRTMVEHLDTHPNDGAAGPKILDVRNKHIRPGIVRRFPTLWTDFCSLGSLDRRLRPGWIFDRQDVGHWDLTVERDVPCLSGCCMMVRREAIEDVGALDERFFLYGEDIEWCYRLRLGGWGVHYLPQAVIEHHHGASAHQRELFALACTLESRSRFYARHHGRTTAALYRLIVMAAGLAWMGMACAASHLFGSRSGADRMRRALVYFRWAARGEMPSPSQ